MEDKYLVLVNRNNPLKDESVYEKVDCKSLYADNRTLEKETLEEFLKLKEFIRKWLYY